MTLQKEFVQILQKGFHAARVLQKGLLAYYIWPYVMVVGVRKQVATFQEATNTAIGHSATRREPTLAAVGVLEKQLQ